MKFYDWALCVVGLQREGCLRLRKVIEWNCLHTLTFREAVPPCWETFISDKQTSKPEDGGGGGEGGNQEGEWRMPIWGEGVRRGERRGNSRHHLLWREGLMFPFYCHKGLVQKYAQIKHPMNTQKNEKTHQTGERNIIHCISLFFPLQFD